ncbi:MAG: ABC transporter permease [Corynebacterium sp.]|nr:ABC transporter permease [Corynebacterium sp.]
MMFLTSALTNALRSETTKLLSLRSTLVYTILMAGSLFGTATLIVLFSPGDPVTMDWAKLGYGYQIFQLIAVVFAAATTAGDIRNHLHAQAFLTQRGRWQWVGAKIIVTMVFVAASYLVGTALSLGISAALGAELILGAGETAFYVPLIGSMVFAAVSVGLACVIRSEVGAVAVPVAWMLLIDGMLGMAAESMEIFRPLAMIAPGQRQEQLISGFDPLDLGLSTAACYVIILGWLVVASGVGLWRNRRSDVR